MVFIKARRDVVESTKRTYYVVLICVNPRCPDFCTCRWMLIVDTWFIQLNSSVLEMTPDRIPMLI